MGIKSLFKRRVGIIIVCGLIVIIGICLVFFYSGWLLAQAERWPFTATIARRLTPLFPAKLRAPGCGIAVSSDNRAVRDAAYTALEEMGPEAQAAIPKLLKGLKQRQARIRRAAVEALGNMGESARETVPQITEALRDRSAAVRAAAAEALAGIRERADIAVPALKKAAHDTAANVREAAREALDKFGQKEPSVQSDTDTE